LETENKISILPFVLILFLFLGQNVLDMLHYPQSDPTSGPLYRLHPLTYLLFFLWGVKSIKENTLYNIHSAAARSFGLIVLLVFVYSITLGKSKANFFILDTLFASVLLVQLLQDESEETKAKLLYWLKVFFILNCGIAIVERGISTIIFKPTIEFVFEAFRSYGLLGHPLNNSLVTGFLTLFFVIISEGTGKKFFFLGLGIMAIFAFGGRTALAAVMLTFPFLLYFDLKNYGSEEAAGKFFNYLFLFIIMLVLFGFVLVSTPFGERIFASAKFDDDSADVRSRVFDMFRHFSLNDLVLGIEESKIMAVMYLEKVEIIENFWIIWVFKYGLILTALLGIFLTRFLWSLFSNLDIPIRLILLFVIFLVASGNNSMATNTTAISIITLAALVGFNAYGYQTDDEPEYAEEESPVYPEVQPKS
jgi:ABC-type multidrug transport system fused ATPase/permease subunit